MKLSRLGDPTLLEQFHITFPPGGTSTILFHRRTSVVSIRRYAQAATRTMIDPVNFMLVLSRHLDAVISYPEPTVEPYRNSTITRELPWIISFLGVNVQVGVPSYYPSCQPVPILDLHASVHQASRRQSLA